MSEEEASEKEHEATQKKLDDARRRGEVVKSADLAAAAAYGALALAAATTGQTVLTGFGEWGVAVLDRLDELRDVALAAGSAGIQGMIAAALMPMLPVFIVPLVAVVAVLFAQRAWVLAPEKLHLKLSRVDPITNAGQKFGRNGLFEFAKSTTKLVLFALLLGLFLWMRMPRILVSQGQEPRLVVINLLQMLVEFLLLVFLVAVVLGALDYLWQRHEHLRRNRMSRQELMDELKQSEGDPHMRGQRRQRAEAIATNRMLADVPRADVVIVNPTHFAVALRWDRAQGQAPICVAKGVDEVAARIREAAVAAGVPIHLDPPTARALHASVDIGRQILPEHYGPVAAAIRFAERMRKFARARHGR